VRRPGQDEDTLITKGALDAVVAACTGMRQGANAATLTDADRDALRERAAAWRRRIPRAGLATRTIAQRERYAVDDEQAMVFEGFLLFFDPPKPMPPRRSGS